MYLSANPGSDLGELVSFFLCHDKLCSFSENSVNVHSAGRKGTELQFFPVDFYLKAFVIAITRSRLLGFALLRHYLPAPLYSAS